LQLNLQRGADDLPLKEINSDSDQDDPELPADSNIYPEDATIENVNDVLLAEETEEMDKFIRPGECPMVWTVPVRDGTFPSSAYHPAHIIHNASAQLVV
jgi:hypothetical protein